MYITYIVPEVSLAGIFVKHSFIRLGHLIRLEQFSMDWFVRYLPKNTILEITKVISGICNKFTLKVAAFTFIAYIGESLITLGNRPAQVGKFLTQLAHWFLDIKKVSPERTWLTPKNYTLKA